MATPPRPPRAYAVNPPPPSTRRTATRAKAAVAAARQRMRRYPVWSARMIFLASVVGVSIAAPCVFWFEHKRVIVEAEHLLGAVAVAMFLFLTVGLYNGVRVRKREAMAGDLQLVRGLGDNWGDAGNLLDIGGDGCGEAVGGIVLGVVLLIVLVIGIWLFINVAVVVFFLLSIAVGWVFQRALRQVFAKSRQCRGRATASLLYAAWYTFIYTGWLFALLMLVDRVTRTKG